MHIPQPVHRRIAKRESYEFFEMYKPMCDGHWIIYARINICGRVIRNWYRVQLITVESKLTPNVCTGASPLCKIYTTLYIRLCTSMKGIVTRTRITETRKWTALKLYTFLISLYRYRTGCFFVAVIIIQDVYYNYEKFQLPSSIYYHRQQICWE